ncbi:methyltransferase domain-containing protein [Thermosynechococcaceae cyanobacterium Okahandja]
MKNLEKILYINLGCGDCFIDDDLWLNLDFSPCDSSVRQANLLGKLPLLDESIKFAYSSHFLEHIPYEKVDKFLAECYRILQKNGIIRLVVPDLENICQEYLEQRKKGEHEKANFCIIELLDQCVRTESGGRLGRYYRDLAENEQHSQYMIDYVRYRMGEDILNSYSHFHSDNRILDKFKRLTLQKINRRVASLWISFITSLLPRAFREQNISYCSIGEKHAWMWDFYTLSNKLTEVGFRDIQKLSYNTSNIPDFPLFPLDINSDGTPRKGCSSMYVEAMK